VYCVKGKGKAIPVTGRTGPLGCETSRLPHFLQNRLIDGREVVSRTRRPAGRPLPPGRFLVLISVRGWVDPRAIVRLEGLGQLKDPVIWSRIEPATFRLVPYCLDQLRSRMCTFLSTVPLHSITADTGGNRYSAPLPPLVSCKGGFRGLLQQFTRVRDYMLRARLFSLQQFVTWWRHNFATGA
jgi:hypothetical protein